jgi:putative flippase GtrA
MFDWRSASEWKRLIRYYQAGVVNTAFGYGLFALFVWLGLNVYLAQVIAHVLGVIFNYFTYSRHTFRGEAASKARFVLSYGVNYVFSVGFLWLFEQVVTSPYISGLLATVVVSVINFFILKTLVFSRQSAA